MRIIPHTELSELNRYQVIARTADGKQYIQFGPNRAELIARSWFAMSLINKKIQKQSNCAHIYNVSHLSREKKCRSCGLITKDN